MKSVKSVSGVENGLVWLKLMLLLILLRIIVDDAFEDLKLIMQIDF